jgi:hypothetical protein
MLRGLLVGSMVVAASAVASGCATTLSIAGAVSDYKDDYDDDDDDDDDAPSTWQRCTVGYWLAGLAIDGIVVGSDLYFGEEVNGWDALLIAPLAIDAVLDHIPRGRLSA